MASLHFSCLIVLFACLGFCHAAFNTDGEQPPLKIFHHWCALKKDEGPCKALKDRFYFNVETFRCEPFEYGGCQGNENNFETAEECEEMCLVKAKKSPCHLEDEPGPCRGLVPRYFFDSKVNECRRFFYGGCFGNANNFRTLKECQDRCPRNDTEDPRDGLKAEEKAESNVPAVIIPDVDSGSTSHTQPQRLQRPEFDTNTELDVPDYCLSPVEQGECDGTERRFFYNSMTKRCHAFKYSGCGGNKNNFAFKRLCMKTCLKDFRRNSRIRIKTKNANILFRSVRVP
ncbi:tissue factor pathway inhibitor a isoform X2 [Ictalurus punctatus]|uniref:Tissue factor pathway inhibitor n=1 Tax=Ictalurus punctatus TaxID=7998 RepID=A0A2D0R6B2_ICTPU|nr:tissue factor pathway inhibitor a isoform X2 [Ictalurus punctatus]